MNDCKQTNIADLNLGTDDCEGNKKSTKCVIHEGALVDLGLPENSTQEEINKKLLLALKNALIRIQTLENA